MNNHSLSPPSKKLKNTAGEQFTCCIFVVRLTAHLFILCNYFLPSSLSTSWTTAFTSSSWDGWFNVPFPLLEKSIIFFNVSCFTASTAAGIRSMIPLFIVSNLRNSASTAATLISVKILILLIPSWIARLKSLSVSPDPPWRTSGIWWRNTLFHTSVIKWWVR